MRGNESEDESDDDDDDDESMESNEEKEIGVKKAAAALSVGVGSFADPEEAPGLAHFLEHMLFMGSKKYPDENEYEAYLTNHGGFRYHHHVPFTP